MSIVRDVIEGTLRLAWLLAPRETTAVVCCAILLAGTFIGNAP